MIECPDWVTIVPLANLAHRPLTVREYCHGVGSVLIGLPGGLIDRADGVPGRSAAKIAAGRELLEETSYGGGQ